MSTLDSRIRVLDRSDGKLLKAVGGSTGAAAKDEREEEPEYRNTEMRMRAVFAEGDAVVLSGSEGTAKQQAHVFAWDVVSGDVVACLPAGEGVRAVGCVAWNERGGCWAGGCSDGISFSCSFFLFTRPFFFIASCFGQHTDYEL